MTNKDLTLIKLAEIVLDMTEVLDKIIEGIKLLTNKIDDLERKIK